MVLACLLALVPTLAAFVQQAPKGLFNVGPHAQNALTYVSRGYAKEKMGDLNGAMAASGFVESAINQVVSKRMVKKQQLGWTQRGAHLLLQVRTRVLDEEWENTFPRW